MALININKIVRPLITLSQHPNDPAKEERERVRKAPGGNGRRIDDDDDDGHHLSYWP